MKVRALKTGYYDLLRRREGDVFELKEVKGLDRNGKAVTYSPESQFSEKWMERFDQSSAKKPQSKKSAANIHSDAEVI